MKTYTFIAAIAVCLQFVSCSTDDMDVVSQRSKKNNFPDSHATYNKERDSLNLGEPLPPKPKG